MNTFRLLLLSFLLSSFAASAQMKFRTLPGNINHPAFNNFAPYISLDGNSMLYVSDAGEDYAITLNYTTRTSVNWKDPVVLPRLVNNSLNYQKGYALSADGKTMYLTNTKGNGMGGFDIYYSQLKGLVWTEPVNMLLPVNSKTNDGCPSISLDGSMMFFMRCEKMDLVKADGCKLFWLKKKTNGQWGDPVELPAHINTGNSQTPRIMPDSESLIFSSDRIQPNKGGMDLYMSRLVNDQWGPPLPLDFTNTPGNDQYISVSSPGLYLIRDAQGKRSSELVELLFPPEIRPVSLVRIEGTVAGMSDLSSPYVALYDVKDQRRTFLARPSPDGNFLVYGKQGSSYYLSVDPEQDNYTFFSKIIDLKTENISATEKINITLAPLSADDELTLYGVSFEPHSAQLSPAASQDLIRLNRLIVANPKRSFSIEVSMFGYLRDSVRSDPDLTEVHVDTLRVPVQYQVDSVTVGTRDSLVFLTYYHNDRALRQSKAIGDFLNKQGIMGHRLACSGRAFPEAILENRKTQVKIRVH